MRRKIGTVNTAETDQRELARMMVGREVFMQVDRPVVTRGDSVLTVGDLTYADESGHQLLKHISFNVYENEILGIAGVEGQRADRAGGGVDRLAPADHR